MHVGAQHNMHTKRKRTKSAGGKDKKKAAVITDSNAEEALRKRSSSGPESELTSGKRDNNNSIDDGTNNGHTLNAKKATITLALDDVIVEKIRKEAKELEQSLNARINAILRKHVSFWRIVEVNKGVIFHPSAFQTILDEVDEYVFTEIMKKLAIDFGVSLYAPSNIPPTLDNIVRFSFEELNTYGGSIRRISRYADKQDGKTCLYFWHDYGIKWSRILSAAYSLHLETLLNCHTVSKVFSHGFEIKILEENIC